MSSLDQVTLRTLLNYSPTTGEFTWKNPKSRRVKDGQPAGYMRKNGYLYITILGKKKYAHRLAWLHYYGVEPVGLLDHKDRKRSNNSISNLRETDYYGNAQNRSSKAGVSGLKGIVKTKRIKNPFRVIVGFNGMQKHIGNFESQEIAQWAFDEASKMIGVK